MTHNLPEDLEEMIFHYISLRLFGQFTRIMFSNADLNNLKSKHSLLLSSVNKVKFRIKKHSHICQKSS